ncbi:MAG: DUF3052 family protein [Chloroflexi bacterium]|nr:DUF3052 family protein [Chloroflexota bacterium]
MSRPLSLAAKLGYRTGRRLCAVGAGEEWLRRLQDELPDEGPLCAGLEPDAQYDLVVWWPRRPEEMAPSFASLLARLSPHGSIWAVIPNRAAARRLRSRLSFEGLQQAALSLGLVDTKVTKLSEDEYGVRFSLRDELRST